MYSNFINKPFDLRCFPSGNAFFASVLKNGTLVLKNGTLVLEYGTLVLKNGTSILRIILSINQ